jgi:X-X-X-Leu-X-X-Gly heptad repeat protein
MKYPRLLAASVAASLMLGLAAMPAAVQAAPAGDATAKQSQSKKKLSSDIRKVRQRTTRAERRLRAVNRTIAQLRTLSQSNKGGLDFLLAAAPQLVSGLTQLRDGSIQLRDGLVRAGAGLTALQSALETQIGPGLKRVGDFVGADEYGIGQVTIAGAPAAGSFLVTPNVSDKVQQAQTSQTFVAGAAGALGMLVGVRSNESDGTEGGAPAAHCRVTLVAGNNTLTTGPNAGLSNAPVFAIPLKSTITSTTPGNEGFPFGPKTVGDDADKLVDAGASAVAPTGTAPTVSPGQPYTATLNCVDLSPNADDPTA